jgi:hypothetical protein
MNDMNRVLSKLSIFRVPLHYSFVTLIKPVNITHLIIFLQPFRIPDMIFPGFAFRFQPLFGIDIFYSTLYKKGCFIILNHGRHVVL